MNLQTQPSDDDYNGNNGRDPNLSSSSNEDDDCLSQPSESGAKTDDESVSNAESSKMKCRNCRKLSATVKRLQKLLTSKTAFVTTGLRTRSVSFLRIIQKGISANLKIQLTNEQSSPNQIKLVLRIEYLTEIKATKELERASGNVHNWPIVLPIACAASTSLSRKRFR
jgi:hypothetical protein